MPRKKQQKQRVLGIKAVDDGIIFYFSPFIFAILCPLLRFRLTNIELVFNTKLSFVYGMGSGEMIDVKPKSEEYIISAISCLLLGFGFGFRYIENGFELQEEMKC